MTGKDTESWVPGTVVSDQRVERKRFFADKTETVLEGGQETVGGGGRV